MRIENLKIGQRLGMSFAIVLIMLVAMAGLGISRMAQIQAAMEKITKGNNVESKMEADMLSSVADRMIALRNIVLLSDPAQVQKEVERVQRGAKAYDDAAATLKATFARNGMKDGEAALMAKIGDESVAAQPLIEQVIALGRAGKTAEAVKLLVGDLRTVQWQWNADLAALEAGEKRQNEDETAASDAAYASARTLMLGLGAAALVFGIGLAWSITRGITAPITRAMAIAQTVAAGDLTSRIEVKASDEAGLLLAALKTMNTSLKQIVGRVRTGTETMATASREIAAGNADLSLRTEEQASSLEQTASSMEQLTSTVKQNADNARQANTQAVAASDIAAKGGAVVAQVVGTMDAINESSKKIVDIINVIDSIAFQTNILALNAAVEAARAGEQGRGFAVVATEVRNLAHRSAAAAKEIKTLIDDSVDKVAAGSKLVEEAGATMGDVVRSVRSVGDIIADITAASAEQVLGIEQINRAIVQMDGMTQQNAALVEQSAAAAQSLQDQANDLAKVVSMFVLDERAVVVTAAAAPRQPAARLVAVSPKPKRAAPAAAVAVPASSVRAAPAARRLSAVEGNGDWEEF